MNAHPHPERITADKMVNTIQCGHPDEDEDVLWFLQAMSWQEGGLAALVDRIAEAVPGRIGTPTMRRIGNPPGGKYTAKQASDIWDELPEGVQQAPSARGFWTCKPDPDEGTIYTPSEKALLPESFRRVCVDGLRDQVAAYNGQEKANWQEDDAPGQYPYHGDADLKTRWRSRFHWAVNSWQGAVRDYAQIHAKRELGRCVQTEVTRKVWMELDLALKTRQPVMIEGNARIGKTFAVQAWCRAYPGYARLVTMPSDQTRRALNLALAEAFGIECSLARGFRFLKEQVDWVCKHSGLLLVWDEAHFAWPANPPKNAVPERLNWIRANLIDRQHGCALVTTPQSFGWAQDRFIRRTEYNHDQFIGRINDPVRLPDRLSSADLLKVGRHYFPQVSEARVKVACGMADRSQGYLAFLSRIAVFAATEAKERGEEVVTNQIFDAVLERNKPVMAHTSPTFDPLDIRANHGRRKAVEPVLQATGNRPASVEQEPSGSRAVTPAGMPLRASEGALLPA